MLYRTTFQVDLSGDSTVSAVRRFGWLVLKPKVMQVSSLVQRGIFDGGDKPPPLLCEKKVTETRTGRRQLPDAYLYCHARKTCFEMPQSNMGPQT